jgi:hypothetical protein
MALWALIFLLLFVNVTSFRDTPFSVSFVTFAKQDPDREA